jgi:predicted nucleotidyltransferase
MSHQEHRHRQQAILRGVIGLCRDDPHVLGLTVFGSCARGANDAFSEIDLDCYLADEARTGVQALHQRASELAPTLSVLYLYDQHGLYLFADGVRLDLTYKPPSAARQDRAAGVRILHDPRAVLARELGADARSPARAHPRYFTPGDPAYVTWFLWMVRQSYTWTKRGAQGRERAWSKLVSAADSLHMVRASLIEMRLWTLDAGDDLGTLDPELAARLATTYPRLVPAGLLAATLTLLAIYEDVCPAYCARSGAAYPAEGVAALRRVLAAFDRLQ